MADTYITTKIQQQISDIQLEYLKIEYDRLIRELYITTMNQYFKDIPDERS